MLVAVARHAGAQARRARARALGRDGTGELLLEIRRGEERLLAVARLPEKRNGRWGGELPKAWLGVRTQVLTPELAAALGAAGTPGFRVTEVYPWTEAARGRARDRRPAARRSTASASTRRGRRTPRTCAARSRSAASAKRSALAVAPRRARRSRSPSSLEARPLGAEEARRSRQEEFEFAVRELTFLDRIEQHWERDQVGVVVTDVTSGGWAHMAGLKTGDLVVSVGESPVADVADFETADEAGGRGAPGRRAALPAPRPAHALRLPRAGLEGRLRRRPTLIRRSSSPVAWAALALVAAATAAAGAAEEASDYARLLARVAPAIVNVKVVLKTEYDFGGSVQDQESTIDARGAVVDPRGLVLIWNCQLSAGRLLEAARQMGAGEGLQLKITPTDFRVSVPGRAEEYRAFLAGADSDLDLAFLQIEGALDAPLAAIDFDDAEPARLGETVVGVSRLSPAFDRAAFFETARVAGEITKPRRAWVLDASPALLGLPVFSLRGEPVGVVVTVLSRVAESARAGRRHDGLLRARAGPDGERSARRLPGAGRTRARRARAGAEARGRAARRTRRGAENPRPRRRPRRRRRRATPAP